jgi:hypothetical protein
VIIGRVRSKSISSYQVIWIPKHTYMLFPSVKFMNYKILNIDAMFFFPWNVVVGPLNNYLRGEEYSLFIMAQFCEKNISQNLRHWQYLFFSFLFFFGEYSWRLDNISNLEWVTLFYLIVRRVLIYTNILLIKKTNIYYKVLIYTF